MSNNLDICYKFQPLFDLLDQNNHKDVDTVIITGGRYSLKSYTVSVFSLIALVAYNWNVLYTRYTSMSIVDSVKPEIIDKIELLGFQNRVTDNNVHVYTEKARIAFKGIKTGSRGQTANLKSLSGFNCFVNDEAEELPDYKTFKKVFYSIRSIDKRNLNILILNPTIKQHWIFTEFFEKKGLEGGENCIKDNVMYIHTNYLDADLSIMPKTILNDYNRLKEDNPAEYDNIVLGGWIQEPEGALLPKSKLRFDTILPTEIHFRFAVGDPADTGGDKYSMPFIDVVEYNDQIAFFVRDVIHSTSGIESKTSRIIDKANDNKTEQIYIESNGVGLAAVILLRKQIGQHKKITPFPSTINKEIRIYSHYEFVKRYFFFDKSKYDSDPEYRLFINDATSYTKAGDNKHKKDAIDVLCSAAAIIKIKYAKVLYS